MVISPAQSVKWRMEMAPMAAVELQRERERRRTEWAGRGKKQEARRGVGVRSTVFEV